MRPSVRLRLTAWYSSIFLLGGAALLAIGYVIVSRHTGDYSMRVTKELNPQKIVAAGGGGIQVLTPEAGTKVAPKPGVPFPAPDPRLVLQLEQARTAAEKKVNAAATRQIAFDFALALAGATLVSLLAGWIVAGRALRPVARITATARRVADEGDLGERIALDGPADELRELADTFDAMLERLDRTFSSQRSFVANASHELRTPLAIIRAEVEERLDDPRATPEGLRQMALTVHDAVGRSEALITSLLTLARGQDGVRRRDAVDLAGAARAAVRRCEAYAQERGIRVEVTARPAACRDDRDLLERLVANLVENGVRYNEPGGFVRVELGQRGDQVLLRVENGGEPVPADAVPHLFEPFFRVDNSRSRESGGAGLGLSIVAAVAAAHGGAASAEARAGGGLVVTVALPVSGGARGEVGDGSQNGVVLVAPADGDPDEGVVHLPDDDPAGKELAGERG